jgi:predicted nucleic acid-binding protein
MTCSTLGIVEIVATLVRKRNDGRLSASLFAQAMDKFKAEVIDHPEFAIASVDDELLLSALNLVAQHNLNATDAIILRSVLNLRQFIEGRGERLLLWTCDKRLARAARREGITVFDPEEETLEYLHQQLQNA